LAGLSPHGVCRSRFMTERGVTGLLLPVSGVLVFIDFEYGAYNYEAFDIGNHFAEYAGTV